MIRSSSNSFLTHHHVPWIAVALLSITTGIGTYLSYSIYATDNQENPIHVLNRLPAASINSPHLIDTKSSTTSLPYFANKSNFINQKFVKLAWAWTSLVIWFHLFNLAGYLQQIQIKQQLKKTSLDNAVIAKEIPTPKRNSSSSASSSFESPQYSPRPVPRIIVLYIISSLLWVVLTQWFFGSPLIERLLMISGGKCVPSIKRSQDNMDHSDQLDHIYCQRRWGQRLQGLDRLTISTHRPYWTGGLDVSGHVFLMSFSILVITSSLLPSLGQMRRLNTIPKMYRNSIFANGLLIVLWWWMLLMTSLYFHGPSEKALGLILGTASWWLTERIIEKLFD